MRRPSPRRIRRIRAHRRAGVDAAAAGAILSSRSGDDPLLQLPGELLIRYRDQVDPPTEAEILAVLVAFERARAVAPAELAPHIDALIGPLRLVLLTYRTGEVFDISTGAMLDGAFGVLRWCIRNGYLLASAAPG